MIGLENSADFYALWLFEDDINDSHWQKYLTF